MRDQLDVLMTADHCATTAMPYCTTGLPALLLQCYMAAGSGNYYRGLISALALLDKLNADLRYSQLVCAFCCLAWLCLCGSVW
jgi:hypothetical protein